MTKPFRVLISDTMSPRAAEILEASAAVEVDVKQGISPEDLLECIDQYHGLLVRSRTKVTAEVMARAAQLKVIGRAGIGVDNIDVSAASRHGVLVENAPSGNAITTAEHAICLLLSMVRNIPKATASMKQNKWEKKKLQGSELYGKNFGVIGLGNIGRIVADRGLGLRMKVIGYDPFITHDAAGRLGIELVALDELLQRSDFITIHTPLTDDTRGLLSVDEFAKMKDGVFLVNAARGGIVDESACHAALESGKVAGAAFDVFVEEPPPADHPLVMHANVVCTPHLGASTGEAQVKVAVEVAEQMVDYAEKGEIRNALNATPITGEMRLQSSPWLGLCNKLGALLGQLLRGTGDKAESLEVEVIGDAYQGSDACSDQALVGLLNSTAEVPVNEVNARIVAKDQGLEFSETRIEQGQDLHSGVRLRARYGNSQYTVVGTLYHLADRVEARVVQINEFLVELAPTGRVLVVRNKNEPGVIGAVGSLLGAKNINVNSLAVAHDQDRSVALALWSIDAELSASALADLSSLDHVVAATVVGLD